MWSSPAAFRVSGRAIGAGQRSSSSLRIAGKERDSKTTALYSYLTSERFWQHLTLMDSSMEKALEIDVKEKKDHGLGEARPSDPVCAEELW
jgi:hypothetical protein